MKLFVFGKWAKRFMFPCKGRSVSTGGLLTPSCTSPLKRLDREGRFERLRRDVAIFERQLAPPLTLLLNADDAAHGGSHLGILIISHYAQHTAAGPVIYLSGQPWGAIAPSRPVGSWHSGCLGRDKWLRLVTTAALNGQNNTLTSSFSGTPNSQNLYSLTGMGVKSVL